MSTIPPEFPMEENTSKTEAQVWLDLRDYFRESLRTLEQICDKDGPEAAKLEQDYMLKDMEDRATWERMFLEGAMRNLATKDAVIVIETYDALCNLAAPVISISEVRLKELLKIRDHLSFTHRQICEAIRAGVKNNIHFTLNYDLDYASKRLEEYRDLVKIYPQAAQLIEESKVIIIDFRTMIRRSSKK